MLFWGLAVFFSWILDLFALFRLSDSDKDLELLILRQQIAILERNVDRPRLSKIEKLTLAVLVHKFKVRTGITCRRLAESVFIFRPETILRWHRELVKRKWTFKHRRQSGRPRIDPAVEALIVRLARENPRWGYGKIEGELLKLGHDIGRTTIKDVLRRHNIPPAPERGHTSWRTFLNHYRDQILACDFFTVETLFLKTIYVLFFIEIGTRRIHIAGYTDHPHSAWVTQQARNLTWNLQERELSIRYLIHDRDTKFCQSFDRVFESEGCRIIVTPIQAPNANAFAERWVRTVREECLDRILICNQRHLQSVLSEFSTYHNEARPHQGLNQRIPMMPTFPSTDHGPVHCRDVLGGIIHDYHRLAG
jgi:putative transposase